VKRPIILLAAFALASCAPPKAIVIAEAPIEPVATIPTAPANPALADDGLRLPDDMLALPDDNQLRSAAPLKKEGDATIITSPPTE
jgi:hypothetical protein